MNNDTTVVFNKDHLENSLPLSGEIDSPELKAVISVISGKEKGKNFTIDQSIILGRADNVDCMIQDEMISRTHLRITFEDNHFLVEDMNSKNGTYIDDNQIKKVSVIPGTVVSLGNSLLVLSLKSQAQIDAEKELYQAATTDVLTNIANRSWFMKRALEEFSYANYKNLPITIIMMDIDFFKKVNDNYGHQGGDYILKSTTAVMKEHIRDHDLLGRYGGEEFIIFLKGMPADKSYDFAERIRLAIQEQQLNFNNKKVQVTISIGVCTLETKHQISLEQTIALADKQLYLSKNSGRNQTSIENL